MLQCCSSAVTSPKEKAVMPPEKNVVPPPAVTTIKADVRTQKNIFVESQPCICLDDDEAKILSDIISKEKNEAKLWRYSKGKS